MVLTNLFITVSSLVSLAVLGAVFARNVSIDVKSIASLLIYIVSPLAIFSAIDSVPFQLHYLLFTVFFYVTACVLATLAYHVGRYLWPQQIEANLLAFSAGTGNTGYFGLSLAILLLSPQSVAIVAFSTFGLALYEFTYGYYLVARQDASMHDSLRKLAKLPLVYVFVLALLCEHFHIVLPTPITTLLAHFKGTYSVLGMMLIGISLTGLSTTRSQLDWRFLGSTFLFKFVLWPLVILAAMYIPLFPNEWLTPAVVNAMLLLSVMPLAGNCVVVAAQLGTKPEKVALTVMLSIAVAMITVPLFLSVMLTI